MRRTRLRSRDRRGTRACLVMALNFLGDTANAIMLSPTTSDHTNPSDSLDYLSTVIHHYLDAAACP